jgi:hypothetical protein
MILRSARIDAHGNPPDNRVSTRVKVVSEILSSRDLQEPDISIELPIDEDLKLIRLRNRIEASGSERSCQAFDSRSATEHRTLQ